MFPAILLDSWKPWVGALAAPLHRRLAWRLPIVVTGLVLASSRRTATSWWRAAQLTTGLRSYYYFLDAVGRKADAIALVLLRLLAREIPQPTPLLFALDDSPTKRYGVKVQGAGIHHNPTPGTAGSKFLYGHNWVSLSRVVHHPRFGVIGLPLLARLSVRKIDVPKLPDQAKISFRTKLQQAAEMITTIASDLPKTDHRPWAVVDGAYAKREFLRPAMAAGWVVVARLRRDAALFDLPPIPLPGTKRGRGRPPIYGKNALSLAKRAGQKRGWSEVTSTTASGRVVVVRFKSFLAAWRPVGGVIRVVILRAQDDSWRAFLCTDRDARVESIVPAIHDRWSIEANYRDLKQVERVGEVQLRRVWANVGAFHLGMWVHTLTELWAWKRSAGELSDRRESPWDDASRRPSHAERRRALQRAMWHEEYRRLGVSGPLGEKILPLLDRITRLAG